MTAVPSNLSAPRRITQGDEAYLRKFRAEMKFTTAGPFARLLDPIRAPKPVRDKAGNVVDPQPRYSATSAESWLIGSRLPSGIVAALVAKFGREYNSVLDDPTDDEAAKLHLTEAEFTVVRAALAKRKPRRRGSRGGRKPVAS